MCLWAHVSKCIAFIYDLQTNQQLVPENRGESEMEWKEMPP